MFKKWKAFRKPWSKQLGVLWRCCVCACVSVRVVPWGSYFDQALAWEKRMDDPDVMIVTYEELKEVSFIWKTITTQKRIKNESARSFWPYRLRFWCCEGPERRRPSDLHLLWLQPDGGSGAADRRAEHLQRYEAELLQLPRQYGKRLLQKRYFTFTLISQKYSIHLPSDWDYFFDKITTWIQHLNSYNYNFFRNFKNAKDFDVPLIISLNFSCATTE